MKYETAFYVKYIFNIVKVIMSLESVLGAHTAMKKGISQKKVDEL